MLRLKNNKPFVVLLIPQNKTFMKNRFLSLACAFFFTAALVSCESYKNTNADGENADTTVIIPAIPADTANTTPPTVPPQDEPTGAKAEPEKQKSTTEAEPKEEILPEENKKDWRAMLVEY